MATVVRYTTNLGLRILDSFTSDTTYNLDTIDAAVTDPHVLPGGTTDLWSIGAITLTPNKESSGGDVRVGASDQVTDNFKIYADDTLVSGDLTLSDLSTGILHSDSGGLITSSLAVNADVDASAAIAESKLALDYSTAALEAARVAHVSNTNIHPEADSGNDGQVLSTTGSAWKWANITGILLAENEVDIGDSGDDRTPTNTSILGDILAASDSGLTYKLGSIVNEDINASAAIAESKLDLDYATDTLNTNTANHLADLSNPHVVSKTQVGLSNVDNVKQVPDSEKGSINGVATLDGTGKVPSIQLPSYVDDVEEYADLASFPVTGETGKIYVALDTNKTYRWSGSVYAEISPSDVNSVAGKTGIVTLVSSDVGLGNVDNTSDADKPVSTATGTAIGLKEDDLGNPASDGYLLSSTTGGSRSWIAPPDTGLVVGTGAESMQSAVGTAADAQSQRGIAIGEYALVFSSATSGIAIGSGTNTASAANTYQDKGIAIGYNSFCNGTSGAALGTSANVSHSSSTALGVDATTSAAKQIILGTTDSHTFIGGEHLVLATGTADPTASIVEGSSYYNTTDDTLKVYDGSAWNLVGVTDHGEMDGLEDDDHTQYLNTTRHTAIGSNPHGVTKTDVGLGSVLDTAQEPALGNPASDGYVLSSTAAGVRSWIDSSGGGGATEEGVGSGSLISNVGTPAGATGAGSIALGTASDSTGESGIALGNLAQSTGVNSIAIGKDAGTSTESVALGWFARANITGGTAVGGGATSGSNYAVALGYNSSSNALNAVAIGRNASTTVADQIKLGSTSSHVMIGGEHLILPKKSSDPTTSVVEGSFYYNTSDDKIYSYNGASWVELGEIVDGTVTDAKLTSGVADAYAAPVNITISDLTFAASDAIAKPGDTLLDITMTNGTDRDTLKARLQSGLPFQIIDGAGTTYTMFLTPGESASSAIQNGLTNGIRIYENKLEVSNDLNSETNFASFSTLSNDAAVKAANSSGFPAISQSAYKITKTEITGKLDADLIPTSWGTAAGTGTSSLEFIIGDGATASGNYAVALGNHALADSTDSVAIGGDGSSGSGAEATASGSTAIGNNTEASGARSVAIGNNATRATDTDTTAVGRTAVASNTFATAIGGNAVASGSISTAVGAGAGASGTDSTAIGRLSDCTHIRSTSVGYDATSTADDQVILGDANSHVLIPGEHVIMPTGTASPTTAIAAGSMYFNTSDDKIYVYDGSTWKATAALT